MSNSSLVIKVISLCLVILILLSWIIFKIRNPFWSLQPVNHHYQVWRKYQKPGIIKEDFSIPKFMNEYDIKTKKWEILNEDEIINFENYIGNHFLNRNELKYQPTREKHITPYFSEDQNSYLSQFIKDNILLGTITNRTLRVHINNESFIVSYIDYLCVHKGNRKKRIAPELIQTHEYFQRKKGFKKCLVSLFKKEGRLTNIIPLVQFNVKAYNISKLINNNNSLTSTSTLPPGVDCVKITKTNINLLFHFLQQIRHNFPCFIIALPETLTEVIKHNAIHIYTLVQNSEIISAFFFRETGTYSNSSKQNLECFASLNNSIDDSVFIQGFYTSLEKIKDKFKIIYLENTSHSQIIINDIHLHTQPLFTSLCAYYIYNYNTKQLKDPKQCCFIF